MSINKNVWRLKKYSRTEQEIQQQQCQFQELEFSTKPQNPQSIRRPNNQRKKPGETQEFVFVDLSPKKKASPVTTQNAVEQSRVGPTQFHQLNFEQKKKPPTNEVARLFRSSSSGNTVEHVPLSTLKPSLKLSDAALRPNIAPPGQLLSSPTIVQHIAHSPGLSSSQSSTSTSTSTVFTSNGLPNDQLSPNQSSSSPITAYTPPPFIPLLKISLTSVMEKRRSMSPVRQTDSRQRSSSSASISLNVSDSGRAFLDFGEINQTRNNTRSTGNDLSRSNSRRSASPQKLIISPIAQKNAQFPVLQHHRNSEQELLSAFNSENTTAAEASDDDVDDDDDAFKAFSMLVRKNTSSSSLAASSPITNTGNTITSRKRTNTVSSVSSTSVVKPTGLVRQHSVSSITSKYHGRSSPTRLRQTQPPFLNLKQIYQQQNDQVTQQSFPDLSNSNDHFHFFDDVDAKVQPSRQNSYAHAKNFSISNLPTPTATPNTSHYPSTVDSHKKPSLLQPGLDVDRLLTLDLDSNDGGLQSPCLFSAASEQKFDLMGNMTMNINVPQGFEIDGQDDDESFDINAFINYDTTIGHDVI